MSKIKVFIFFYLLVLTCFFSCCHAVKSEYMDWEDAEYIRHETCMINPNIALRPWCDPQRIYMDHVEGRWLDNCYGYSSIGIFFALQRWEKSGFYPFIDVREHLFNNGEVASNVGGGLRYLLPSGKVAIGVNAYYDFRNVRGFKDNFQQIGIGFEALSFCWEIRMNGYFPIGNKFNELEKRFHNFIGDFSATCRNHRAGLWGGDLEIGRWFSPCFPRLYGGFPLYGATGLYAYNSRHGENNKFIGVQARALAFFTRYLSLELKAGYDNESHGMFQGRIALTFSLDTLSRLRSGCDPLPCIKNCFLFQPVNRQEIIPLGNGDCCWEWNWNDSGTLGH